MFHDVTGRDVIWHGHDVMRAHKGRVTMSFFFKTQSLNVNPCPPPTLPPPLFQLAALPLRIEIPSALKRKADLEAKVAKLEAAVTMFSRPRIFVRD